MAWTAGFTFTVGYTLTTAKMNEQVRDNATYLHDRGTAGAATDATPVTMTTSGTYYTGASISLAAGSWFAWFSFKITPPSADDRIIFRIRNTTDNATIIDLSGGCDESRGTGAIVAAFDLSGTKTIAGQITNQDHNGGTIAQASLLTLRNAV